MTPQGFKIVIYPKITSIDKILFFLKIAYNTLKLIILRKNIA